MGVRKIRTIFISLAIAALEVVGVWIGYGIGAISLHFLPAMLAFAGGAMLYVVFGELFPESFLIWKSKAPGAMALVGTMLGLVLVYV